MASLVERLRQYASTHGMLTDADREWFRQAHDEVAALEAMCETLAGAFLETREMLGLAEQIVCEECCPTTWKTADGRPHCKLHQDILAVLLKHEVTRDQSLTQYRAMKEKNDG